MTSTYCYQPLSHKRAIRLIKLHQSLEDDAPLSCNIVETSVDEPEDYYALSYTWGGEAPSQRMLIQGHTASATSESSASIILVTPNCATALRKLRKLVQGSGTGVWVDAVCINQTATEEKSVQVSMMAEIYRHAKSVVIWLGEE
ncbi:ankyrin unc44 [Colletotrichum kahawae]|uniref:Ankyrin unc44 n=1 Tax=Colletotrichum kahawae TaxID=34407 RepID=A0AAD9XVZ1_COLKA|nr:ankyrin unc44 [Colletotrichum kahawae]